MKHYCQYSFEDLFRAATGREMSPDETQKFSGFTQKERNREVAKLAKLANWKTQLVKVTEGDFLAFWPG